MSKASSAAWWLVISGLPWLQFSYTPENCSLFIAICDDAMDLKSPVSSFLALAHCHRQRSEQKTRLVLRLVTEKAPRYRWQRLSTVLTIRRVISLSTRLWGQGYGLGKIVAPVRLDDATSPCYGSLLELPCIGLK